MTDKNLSQTIFFENGSYDIFTDKLTAPTPKIFVTTTLPYNFSPKAKCPTWRWFVNDVFNGDIESINLLQEWLGYNLVHSNFMEQMMFLFGVPGSGKSTTVTVLRELLGPERWCAANIESFTNQFGLAPMVGKYAAIISESQATRRSHAQVALEKIKQITGGDAVSINPKYKTQYDVELFCKITYVGNELPRFDDEPQALFRRFNLLYYANNYFKDPRTPDRTLKNRLLKEIPGIALWAIDGLRRLLVDGDFTKPAISMGHIADCRKLASPLQTMVDDWCELKTGASVLANHVFDLHVALFKEEGLHPMSRVWFGRKLKNAFPDIKKGTKTINGEQCTVYVGMEIKPEAYKTFLGR